MKLRLQGNALRLRLSQSEVARFHAAGRVEDGIEFPGASAFAWSLESDPTVSSLRTVFTGGQVRVLVPAATAIAWTTSSAVGIYSAPGVTPSISIEKDFQCLHPDPQAPSRDESDAYPNPAAHS